MLKRLSLSASARTRDYLCPTPYGFPSNQRYFDVIELNPEVGRGRAAR